MAVSLRIGTSENLPNGSTYDLLVVRTPDGYPEGQVLFEFEETPRKITGIQKVAQTFLRVLFTSKGSDVLRPFFGTLFPVLVLGANKMESDREFEINVSSSIKDAEDQTKKLLNGTGLDPASQLAKITQLGVNSVNDSLSVYIQLTTLAGETASVAIPFPELDLPISQNG